MPGAIIGGKRAHIFDDPCKDCKVNQMLYQLSVRKVLEASTCEEITFSFTLFGKEHERSLNKVACYQVTERARSLIESLRGDAGFCLPEAELKVASSAKKRSREE